MRKRYSMDLSAHIAECDANYARMQALAPALCAPADGQKGADPESLSTDSWEFALEMPGNRVELVVELVERSRYTTLVRFTQHAPSGSIGSSIDETAEKAIGQDTESDFSGLADLASLNLNLAPPTMLIRLYHDANSAEVVEVRNESRFKEVYEYPNPAMRSRDEKAQVNRFLGEYLSMCLRYGLAAEPVTVG